MKITVIVPVYREPERAEDIITKLLANTYAEREIIVIVDGGNTPGIEAALAPFHNQIRIVYNGCQLGKAASVNRIALSYPTDVFLMLDNDIELPADPEFLEKLAGYMGHHDLVEIPKEAITTTAISRMMAFEFLTNAMLSLTMAVLAHRSPSMNGAAFAVRASLFQRLGGFRPVVNEDMDFAARAFRLQASFGCPRDLKVRNDVPTSLHDWVIQRKRWSLNNMLWLKDNFSFLMSRIFRMPALILSSVLMFLPFITYFIVFIAARKTHVSLMMPLLFMVSQHIHIISGFLIHPSHFAFFSPIGWFASLTGMLMAGLLFFIFTRILHFHFNIIDFFMYYLVYSPLWLISNIIALIVILSGVNIKLDWKISPGSEKNDSSPFMHS